MWHRSLLAVMMFCTLFFVAINPANALSLSSVDGDWSNAVGSEGGEPVCLFYLEDRVTFGTPNVLGICPFFSDLSIQSGLEFTGSSATTIQPGNVFVLGELTHYNNQLFRANNLETVDLAIDLSFTDPDITTTLDYTVTLDETSNFPNNGICPYGDTIPCADALEITQAVDEQVFVIDDIEYTLDIVGFTPGTLGQCSYDPANVIDSFVSEEGFSNAACLFARLLIAEPALSIVKTGDTGPVAVGDSVDYAITVTNIGDVELTNVTVIDSMLGIAQNVGTLQPGESANLGAIYTVTEDDLPGPLVNVAGVTSDQTGNFQDSHTVQLNAPALGNVEIVKVVDWVGVAPNEAVIFEICLSGPAFAQPDCQFTDFDGGSLFWNDLEPGTYTVTEVDPGVRWSVQGSGATINVVAGADQTAFITNTYVPTGSISVTKVVDWNGGEVNPAQTFEICVSGSGYLSPPCQVVGAQGGTVTWMDAGIGTYTITETNPGENWTVVGSGVQLVVNSGQNSATTITNTYNPPPPVCDDPNPYRDLTGNLLPETGYSVGRVVNNSEACSYNIGIASYLMYDDIIDNQDIFDFNTVVIGPGQTLELSVALPDCAVQVDLFHGEVLMSLAGVRYGERLIDAVQLVNGNYCVPPGAPPAENAVPEEPAPEQPAEQQPPAEEPQPEAEQPAPETTPETGENSG